MQTFELLDRLELLYPTNDNLADLRRVYNDQDLSSLFRLVNGDEELRKAIIEENLHSIFRLIDNEELRKAVVEENLHSIFRLLPDQVTGNIEDLRKLVLEDNMHSLFRLVEDEELRKAVVEKNLHSVFRLTDIDDDIRSAITEKNLHSIFRLLGDHDLRKLVIEDNVWKLWPILERYINTQFTAAFKNFFVNEIKIDNDCFSRGQLESKLWLVKELEKCTNDVGTVFLCAGWYATLATMLFESNIIVDNIRSFDVDPSCVDIAETFNKPWFVDQWRFKSITQDIMDVDYNEHTWEHWSNANNRMSLPIVDTPDTIINTSCEHITNFTDWYEKIPKGKLVVLQSNNYYEIKEHVNCVKNVQEFKAMAPMTKLLFVGTLPLPKYERFMLIGYK